LRRKCLLNVCSWPKADVSFFTAKFLFSLTKADMAIAPSLSGVTATTLKVIELPT